MTPGIGHAGVDGLYCVVEEEGVVLTSGGTRQGVFRREVLVRFKHASGAIDQTWPPPASSLTST